MTVILRGASFGHYATSVDDHFRILTADWRGTSAVGAWLDDRDARHTLVTIRLVLDRSVTRIAKPV